MQEKDEKSYSYNSTRDISRLPSLLNGSKLVYIYNNTKLYYASCEEEDASENAQFVAGFISNELNTPRTLVEDATNTEANSLVARHSAISCGCHANETTSRTVLAEPPPIKPKVDAPAGALGFNEQTSIPSKDVILTTGDLFHEVANIGAFG